MTNEKKTRAKGGYRGNNIARNEKAVNFEMKDRCKKAHKEEKNLRKKRNMIRKTLEKKLGGRNTTKCRTAIKNQKKSSQKEKAAIKVKNNTKINHLENKFKPKLSNKGVPVNLDRYGKADIFSESSEYKQGCQDWRHLPVQG